MNAVDQGGEVPDLRLGPIVRYADDSGSTVWVETDEPCDVDVAGVREPTFTVEGHHYAIVATDLGCGHPYEVRLDGTQVWPPEGSDFPPSRLGRARTGKQRIVFGSCRTILGETADPTDADSIDALREYAIRASRGSADELPDLLVLLGDQVYDRQGAPQTRAFIRSRRSVDVFPGEDAADFEEYAHLYLEAWGDPAVRWLLSTVPSVMTFDDHDIMDNWNTSKSWVEEMRATPGWRERVTSGLMAYWLYQHLGNHSPSELARVALLADLRRSTDGSEILRDAAESWDAGARGTRGAQWSFVRELADIRLLMVDSRNGRCLEPGRREMLDADEWAWLEEQAGVRARHLLMGTSVPFLLPRGLHEYETWITAVCDGAWGRRIVPFAERIRRDFQFNKWAAFPGSFHRLSALVRNVASADVAPSSISVLSGDVHYSYIARMRSPAAPIHQITASPLCYDLEKAIQGGFRAGMSSVGAAIGRLLRRAARRPAPIDDWSLTSGPWFRNMIATLDFVEDRATARLEQTETSNEPGRRLALVAEQQLAPTPAPSPPSP